MGEFVDLTSFLMIGEGQPLMRRMMTQCGLTSEFSGFQKWQSFMRKTFDWMSAGFGERVIETVEVLSVNDVDRHCSSEPHQLSSAGIRDDGNT